MSLINCPECKKEISNHSEICIHCGYPLKQLKEHIINVNGVEQDGTALYESVSKFKNNEITHSQFCGETTRLLCKMGLSIDSACEISEQIDNTLTIPKKITGQTKAEYFAEKAKPRCPKCGCTSITTGSRGVNGLFGFLGASRTVNRCGKCGHTWSPRG